MTEIAAIILAAGRSTRFGDGQATKLIAPLRGKPLVRHVALAALASRARPVIAVTGHQHDAVEAALAGLGVRCVANHDYASGLSTSLRRGIAALPAACAGTLVLLGDMPLVSAAVIDRLIAAFGAGGAPLAAVPLRAGQRGNPVILGRGLFAALATLEGDRGAGGLIDALRSGVIECAVADDAALTDIDSVETLRGLEKS